MSDGMRRELAYLSSHATNRYFIPNWGNMLARGWLAYPVTPGHTQLPPKSGCREMLAYGYKESAPRIAPRGAS